MFETGAKVQVQMGLPDSDEVMWVPGFTIASWQLGSYLVKLNCPDGSEKTVPTQFVRRPPPRETKTK